MEHRIIRILGIVMVAFVASCYYDVAEELYPPTTCNSDNMSYTADIVPIVSQNCYTCHSVANGPGNGNVILEGYSEIIKYVNSGQLIGAINWESGYARMPQDAPKLSNCSIAKIESWVNDGAPDN